MTEDYDIVIIGAGSAGLIAASLAKQFGVKVALLEKNRIGGDCAWTGCIPSKTLLKTARVVHQMRVAERYGLTAIEPAIDFKSVMSHVRDVVAQVYQHESPEALRANGIDVYLGDTKFLDSHTVAVGESRVTGRHFLLATGAHPAIPPISGLDGVDYLTYAGIWDLEKLPQHLLVLGAGPIGCEMAQAFCRLGAGVTMIEGGDRVLPRDEPMASRVIAEVFTAEGINLRFNAMAERTWQDTDGIHLIAGGEEFAGDALLVAVGRRPNVNGLDLERAGVTYDARGIKVDDHLRTSQRHIYAAGDCTGGYQFTHYAGWQAAKAIRNALFPGRTKGVRARVPWTTFTDPEVAHIGLTEEQAKEKHGSRVMTCQWPMGRVDRALTEEDTTGFMKLIYKQNGALLGVTIVAARAGEMIHGWIIALERSIKVGDLANIIHVYPTYSTASMQASAEIRVSQLLSGTSGKLIRNLQSLIR